MTNIAVSADPSIEQNCVAPSLFSPVSLGGMRVRNRFAMAPMTRSLSPSGVPTSQHTAYYARRAAGGVGLIITEGAVVDEPSSAASASHPRLFGGDALQAWTRIVDAVHEQGAKIIPQIWHVGMDRNREMSPHPEAPSLGPSGRWNGKQVGPPMSEIDISSSIDAFARAAEAAEGAGFDGVEIHGGHGYLVDQFLWEETNQRKDAFGGTIANRSRFPAEIIRECRNRTKASFLISFRWSQWKTTDFDARLFYTPREMEEGLQPLVDAGVDLFHCSTRRFWRPEFDNSPLNLAGWTKKLTGVPTMTVGSVGLGGDTFIETLLSGQSAEVNDLSQLEQMFVEGQFDMVAVGRALISDPEFVNKIRQGRSEERLPFDVADLATLR